MRDQYPILLRSHFEHSVVLQPFETGLIRAFEVDCGLAATDTLNNCVIEIGVRKKANAHCPGFRSSSFARRRRFQSSGLASLSGMLDS